MVPNYYLVCNVCHCRMNEIKVGYHDGRSEPSDFVVTQYVCSNNECVSIAVIQEVVAKLRAFGQESTE